MSLLDYSSYIPVECTESNFKYFEQYYMEKIYSFHILNGEVISKVRQQLFYKNGDVVIIRYEFKDFLGVVDLSQDEEILTEHGSLC